MHSEIVWNKPMSIHFVQHFWTFQHNWTHFDACVKASICVSEKGLNQIVNLSRVYRVRGQGLSSITKAIWGCWKGFSQRQHSFHWKLCSHWLKFLRWRRVAVLIQAPGLSIAPYGVPPLPPLRVSPSCLNYSIGAASLLPLHPGPWRPPGSPGWRLIWTGDTVASNWWRMLRNCTCQRSPTATNREW